MNNEQSGTTDTEEKQCRICLDGTSAEPELGRLIKPCLCKGSISYVHINCLQKWRRVSSSDKAFFSCPQCHYQYRFTRTRIVGIATNPVVIAFTSSTIFVFLTLISSSVTTALLRYFERPTSYTSSYFFGTSWYFVSPLDVVHDLVRAALRILQDEDLGYLLNDGLSAFRASGNTADLPNLTNPKQPGFLWSLVQRFVLGLPLVGAAALVQMVLSMPFIGPLQWIARYRGNRRRDSNSKDIAALVVIAVLAFGALRALKQVYQLTEKVTKKILMRAEDAILEVN